MFPTVMMAFFVANGAALTVILHGLFGQSGPKWSQRWGNLIVVLSIVALLLKNGAPPESVWIPYFDEWSLLLAVVGSFWGAVGDVVCVAFKSKDGWLRSLKNAIDE